MKKLFCNHCFNEIVPGDKFPTNFSLEDYIKKEHPDFDIYSNELKASIRSQFQTNYCPSCESRRNIENTVEFDSEDPVGSLKDLDMLKNVLKKVETPKSSESEKVNYSVVPRAIVILHRPAGTYILIGIVVACVGLLLIYLCITNASSAKTSDIIAAIFLAFVFLLFGLLMIYIGLETSYIKFYCDFIECHIGIKKNSDKPLAFYRNQGAEVTYFANVKSPSDHTCRVMINDETVAKELTKNEARAIKTYLDLYINHGEAKRSDDNKHQSEEDIKTRTVEFN